jgi:hypothetical protein
MKMNKKVVAVLALVAVVFAGGLAYAQVTPLVTQVYGRYMVPTSPAIPVANVGAGCGSALTAPVGTDGGFVLTLGTAPNQTTCAVTFLTAYANQPVCVAQNQTTAANAVQKVTTTTTSVTYAFLAGPTAADKISTICIGVGG